MPPKKKKVAKRVTKMKQKVKVIQQVVVNIGGKGISKRKKSTRVGKKESSKPTYVQVPLIVPSQTFQPSSVAFSSPDMLNSALKTDNTRQQDLIEQIARADATLEKAQDEMERRQGFLARIRHKRVEEGVNSARERDSSEGGVSRAGRLLAQRMDKQREDMRFAMMDD